MLRNRKQVPFETVRNESEPLLKKPVSQGKIEYLDSPAPISSIIGAVLLVVGGTLFIALLPHTLLNIVIGLLLVLPGVYVCGLTLFAYFGVEGYTFDLIPGAFDYRTK